MAKSFQVENRAFVKGKRSVKNPKDVAQKELLFCMDLWEKKGSCLFGNETRCEQCAAPYILYKMCTGKVIHDKRLSKDEWKSLVNSLDTD